MKMAILTPSLLALSLALPAASSLAGECTAAPGAAASASNPVYDPSPEVMRMQAALVREFDALASSPVWLPIMYVPATAVTPPVLQGGDLQRTAEGYQLEFKLPGYRPENVHVHLDGHVLTVSAESSSRGTVQVGQQPEQSLTRSAFAQTLTLPGAVQASGLRESFQNGVLTIRIPAVKTSAGAA